MSKDFNQDGSIKIPKWLVKGKEEPHSLVDEMISRYEPGLKKELDFNEDTGKKCHIVTKSGDKVQSKGEELIADFLFDHNIPFEYDKLIKFSEDIKSWARPDFKIKDSNILIEYWGLCKERAENEEYNQNLERKRGLYLQEEMELIEVFNEELERIEEYLTEELEKNGYKINA